MATAPSPNDLTRQQLDELDALLQRMLDLPVTAVAPPPPASTAGPPTVANWRADPPAPGPVPAPHLAPAELPRPPARAPKVTVTVHPVAEMALAPPPEPAVPVLAAPPEPAVPVLAARAVPELAPAPAARVPVTPEPAALGPAEEYDAPIITPPARPSLRGPAARPPRPVHQGAHAPRPPRTEQQGAYAPRSPEPIAVAPTPSSESRAPDSSPLLRPLVLFDRAVCAVLGAFGPPGWLLRSGFGKNLLGLAGVGLVVYTAAHVAAARGLVALPFRLPWPR